MLNWILKFIPQDYKWTVGIKKASYGAGKAISALLMYGWIGEHIGSKISPDHMQAIQGLAGAATAAGLEALHDWLRVKFPSATWL